MYTEFLLWCLIPWNGQDDGIFLVLLKFFFYGLTQGPFGDYFIFF